MSSPLRRLVDERFLSHRLRATSVAGMAGAVTAFALLAYRRLHDGTWSWDLFAVIAVMAAVKTALMIRSLVKD
jgi:hypothetical protein